MVFLKEIFVRVYFEKNHQTIKKHKNLPVGRVKIYLFTSVAYIQVLARLDFFKLEDLKVLRRSPDLLNNVKIGQG